MSNYRRTRKPGGTYFFTVVANHRRPLFNDPVSRDLLRTAFKSAQQAQPFKIDAICLLPDHLHTIWTLPDGDCDYSRRWGRIKGRFSHDFLAIGGKGTKIGASHKRKGEVGIWQRRFWEHLIRDENDYQCHVDYIHYNPVKHGYVYRVSDWQWSSFHRYVQDGIYAENWGEHEPVNIINMDLKPE